MVGAQHVVYAELKELKLKLWAMDGAEARVPDLASLLVPALGFQLRMTQTEQVQKGIFISSLIEKSGSRFSLRHSWI